jgi:hypothetical protein
MMTKHLGVLTLLLIVVVGCASGRVLHDSDGSAYAVKVMSDGRTWTIENLHAALLA